MIGWLYREWKLYMAATCLEVLRCFFFKQKTAYEMRISDWSSDVCSSDLHRHAHHSCEGIESGSRLRGRHPLDAEREEQHERQRCEDGHPLQRRTEDRLVKRGRARDQQRDERRDTEAQRHVAIDAEHVPAKAFIIDGCAAGARRRRGRIGDRVKMSVHASLH